MKSPIKRLAYIKASCHSVGVAVLIGGGVLAYYFAFRPLAEAKADIVKRQVHSQELLDQGPSIEKRFLDLEERVEDLAVALDESADRVPATPEEAEFLAQVAQLAQMSELVIVDYRAGEVLTKEMHQEMTLALSTTGTYASICLFLEHLNKLPRLCRVAEVKVGTDQKGEIYPCEMTLTIYYGLKD